MSLFERINNKRYDLQEVKKKFSKPPEGDGNENVKTETKRNRKIEKKYVKNPNNNQPPQNEPPKPEDKLTKHQKLRQQTEIGRKKYNLKPDSRGIYKPTKSSVLGSIETNIKKSSTPPKVSAKKDASSLKKYNQQMRKSQKYSGNENNKRVQKILQRVAKNQKIDKSKAGLVQRQKDLAYGKNPYKPKFGSVNLNLQKKYDDMMLKYGGKDSKLMTQKQIAKLKTKIASKPAEKTMTYLSPAGSGKPVPLKTRRIKKVYTPPEPEIEKIFPKGNPRVTTSRTNYVAPPPKATQLTKLSKHLMKNKNRYAIGAGLALATTAALIGRSNVKQKEKKRLAALAVKKNQDKVKPVSVSFFLNKTGTTPKNAFPSTTKSTPSVYDKNYIKNLKSKTTTPKNNPISKNTSGVSNAARKSAALPYDSSKIASYAKSSMSSKNVKPPKPLNKKQSEKINQQVNKYVADRKVKS